MTASKFIEVLDPIPHSRSASDVSLEDILEQTAMRRSSGASDNGPSSASSNASDREQNGGGASGPIKSRLRRLTLGKRDKVELDKQRGKRTSPPLGLRSGGDIQRTFTATRLDLALSSSLCRLLLPGALDEYTGSVTSIVPVQAPASSQNRRHKVPRTVRLQSDARKTHIPPA
ncbi:hypothetical protein L228DRAFT_271230 [Xylona heveae TC161]|uniref:Uncharacterized protein n=1 Tax=Xylona heveae (strain CBS 132557 / TC161) TaxID=1328760 RepID=A0A164ZRJ3_XYLHT|nr:hypothetical protein L228DRAFT_271230 [Xylona heveae TC161]KZF19421.1 hypothetical protein L228DRAFT_271230 [Xylona heveae TC161]